jgi:hypothetical protein
VTEDSVELVGLVVFQVLPLFGDAIGTMLRLVDGLQLDSRTFAVTTSSLVLASAAVLLMGGCKSGFWQYCECVCGGGYRGGCVCAVCGCVGCVCACVRVCVVCVHACVWIMLISPTQDAPKVTSHSHCFARAVQLSPGHGEHCGLCVAGLALEVKGRDSLLPGASAAQVSR